MRVSRETRERVELAGYLCAIDDAEIKAASMSKQRAFEFAIREGLSIKWLLTGDLSDFKKARAKFNVESKEIRTWWEQIRQPPRPRIAS